MTDVVRETLQARMEELLRYQSELEDHRERAEQRVQDMTAQLGEIEKEIDDIDAHLESV